MSIAVTVGAGVVRKDLNGTIRRSTVLTVTGLTAGADNTIPHTLPYAPRGMGLRPAKSGTTPGGWTETQTADATNIYLTVNTNGSTSGKLDVSE